MPKNFLKPFSKNKSKFVFLVIFLELLVISFVAHFHNLGQPRAIVFDETYHIPSAQKYLNGKEFMECHPPLGKLLLALGEKLYNGNKENNQFVDIDKLENVEIPADFDFIGYRWPSAFFGSLVGPIVFLIIYFMLRKKSKANTFPLVLAFVSGLAVVLDNAMLVQFRSAMIDSFLLFFITLSAFIFVLKFNKLKGPRSVSKNVFKYCVTSDQLLLDIGLGVTCACAATVKLTGLVSLVFVFMLFLKLLSQRCFKRLLLFAVTFGLSFLLVYVMVWETHIFLGGDWSSLTTAEATKYNISSLLENHIHLFTYQKGVPRLDLCKEDEIGSPWYMWLFGGRAINYRWETPDSKLYRYIYLVGNPASWMLSLSGVVLTAALVVGIIFFGVRIGKEYLRWASSFWLVYISYIVPFWFIGRVMYLYHYLPAVVFGIILWAVLFSSIDRVGGLRLKEKQKFFLLFLLTALVIAAFYFYKPLTYYELLDDEQFERRNLFPVWDMKCIRCE